MDLEDNQLMNKGSFLSYSNFYASPFYLRTISKLVGIDAAPLESAKILELGCAAGGNIIPFAVSFPGSQIVGIDSSEQYIKTAIELKNQLKLTNIDLIASDIMELDLSIGKFDYIIVHDVYSWVSDEVQKKILSICRENLNPNGLVFLSYHTLPGWNNLSTVRDFALYHAQNFETIPEKINQVRLLFDYVSEVVQNSDSAYAKLMIETAEMLKSKPDFSIEHDFLDPKSKACYFFQFIEAATENALKYVVDADIAKLYLDNYPKIIKDKIGKIDDPIRMEQFLDFLTNRAFRQTILCHEDQAINKILSIDLLPDFYFKMNLFYDSKMEEEEMKFYIQNNQEDFISTSNPILKSIFMTLSENPQYVSFNDVISISGNRLNEVDFSAIEAQAKISLMDLFLRGKLDVRADLIKVNTETVEFPKIWEYAVMQSKFLNQSTVTNLYFESVQLNLFEYYLIRHLDGKNSKEKIINKMLKHFKNGELETNYNGNKVTSDEKLVGVISLAMIDAMVKFKAEALLVEC